MESDSARHIKYRDLIKIDAPGVQFNRHLKFKAWVEAWAKDEVKDAFRKALHREINGKGLG